MTWLTPLTLQSSTVILEPLSLDRHDQLVEAASDGELWNLWYTFVPTPQTMRSEMEKRLAQQRAGSMLPFAVIERATGRAAGITTFMNADAESKRVEIGSTWYRRSVQRTSLNTECKLLLLRHAFEELDCIAVEFRTHVLNHASRRAIERLGAHLDGILRNHRLSANGTLRDTCVYSIIRSEWPTVEVHLAHLLSKPDRPA
jgi:RimJ/RimL family protein N-acetyltransferase